MENEEKKSIKKHLQTFDMFQSDLPCTRGKKCEIEYFSIVTFGREKELGHAGEVLIAPSSAIQMSRKC